MKYDTEKIRSANPLKDRLERYGVEFDRKGFARCPFHNEKTASFKVYPDNTYHCFGCGAHGDVITFIMAVQNLSFEDACAVLDRDISYSEQRRIDRIKRKRNDKIDRLNSARIRYWNAFDEWKLNEDFIEVYKPQNAEEQPLPMFLTALGRREICTQNLNRAETEYVLGGERIGRC